IQQFKTSRVPVVLAATHDEENELPSVNIDYEIAAYEATKHLIETTKEQPAFITGADSIQSNGLKMEGYLRALKDADITVDESLIVQDDSYYTVGIDDVEQLLVNIYQ